MGTNELDLQNMSETLSESSWKSKDVCYFATTSKNMLLDVKMTLLPTRNEQTSD